jgi:hypothetical protein
VAIVARAITTAMTIQFAFDAFVFMFIAVSPRGCLCSLVVPVSQMALAGFSPGRRKKLKVDS